MSTRLSPRPSYRSRPGCEWRGVLAPASRPRGATPPKLAGGDACGTGTVLARFIGTAIPPSRPATITP